MLGPEGVRLVALADQVARVGQGPVGARPPGLDLEDVAQMAQALGRRALRCPGGPDDIPGAPEADRRIGAAVAQRSEREPEVERTVEAEVAERRQASSAKT